MLATDRQYGAEGGIGPIPWSCAIRYAEARGFSRAGQLWFADVLLTLDDQWRESEKTERAKEKRREDRTRRREEAKAKKSKKSLKN